jgi:N-acetylmuramoyl-L-alanine amidase
MRRLFLSAGHTNTKGYDRGAKSYHDDPSKWVWEGDLAYDLREEVKKELESLYGITVNVDEGSNALKATLSLFNKYVREKDIAIDIHFNSSVNAGARGTEVLVPANPTAFELELAKDLSVNIASVIPTLDRGVKTELQSHHGKLGWMRMPCENILIEVCFISNQADFTWYISNKNRVIKAIASVIAKAMKKQ